jgi:hypothetical protein
MYFPHRTQQTISQGKGDVTHYNQGHFIPGHVTGNVQITILRLFLVTIVEVEKQ